MLFQTLGNRWPAQGQKLPRRRDRQVSRRDRAGGDRVEEGVREIRARTACSWRRHVPRARVRDRVRGSPSEWPHQARQPGHELWGHEGCDHRASLATSLIGRAAWPRPPRGPPVRRTSPGRPCRRRLPGASRPPSDRQRGGREAPRRNRTRRRHFFQGRRRPRWRHRSPWLGSPRSPRRSDDHLGQRRAPRPPASGPAVRRVGPAARYADAPRDRGRRRRSRRARAASIRPPSSPPAPGWRSSRRCKVVSPLTAQARSTDSADVADDRREAVRLPADHGHRRRAEPGGHGGGVAGLRAPS